MFSSRQYKVYFLVCNNICFLCGFLQADSAKRRRLMEPAREVCSDGTTQLRPATPVILTKYAYLNDAMKATGFYEPLYFKEDLHIIPSMQPLSPKQRHIFFSDLRLSMPVVLFRYNPGGSYVGTAVLWRPNPNSSQDEDLTKNTQIVATLQKELPVFHTRQMISMFKKRWLFNSIRTKSPSGNVWQLNQNSLCVILPRGWCENYKVYIQIWTCTWTY